MGIDVSANAVPNKAKLYHLNEEAEYRAIVGNSEIINVQYDEINDQLS